MWRVLDRLVGRTVLIETAPGEDELATVIAVSDNGSGNIKVKSHVDGETLIGNQYEEI